MIGRWDVYIGETRKRRGLDLLDNCAHFPVLNVCETQRVWWSLTSGRKPNVRIHIVVTFVHPPTQEDRECVNWWGKSHSRTPSRLHTTATTRVPASTSTRDTQTAVYIYMHGPSLSPATHTHSIMYKIHTCCLAWPFSYILMDDLVSRRVAMTEKGRSSLYTTL